MQATLDAVRRAERARTEQFIEYVIGEADTHLRFDTLTIDALRDALHELAVCGYNCDPAADDPVPVGFAGVAAATDLRGIEESYHRVSRDRLDGPNDSVEVDGIEYYTDSSLPKWTILVVHPDAIAPMPPGGGAGLTPGEIAEMQAYRPWLVRNPDGVVVVEVDGDE
jgi:hypothetical protein